MREVSGSNPLGGNILCSPSPSEETINECPYTLIPMMHALICEELTEGGSAIVECHLQNRYPACMRTKLVRILSFGIKVVAP